MTTLHFLYKKGDKKRRPISGLFFRDKLKCRKAKAYYSRLDIPVISCFGAVSVDVYSSKLDPFPRK